MTTNDDLKNASAAETWLMAHPHEALVVVMRALVVRYRLTETQMQEVIRGCIIMAANTPREERGNK